MRRTRDRPCDKLVAFQLSTHPFLALFSEIFYDDLFLDIPHFLPPSINFSPLKIFPLMKIFLPTQVFYPPKIFLPPPLVLQHFAFTPKTYSIYC